MRSPRAVNLGARFDFYAEVEEKSCLSQSEKACCAQAGKEVSEASLSEQDQTETQWISASKGRAYTHVGLAGRNFSGQS